jgi:predicted dehydrogenase
MVERPAATKRRRGKRQRRIRTGVVGLGYWGPNLVRNLADAPAFELAYLCDVRAEVVESVSLRYPLVPYTTNFEDLLYDDSIEAVVIATPVSTHYPLTMSALGAGKHAFVEKPLAVSSGEAIEMIQLASANDLVLMPGHTFVYSPPVKAIKELIRSGELGDVYFISSSRVNLGLHQPDVSVVWDLGPHDFSILRYWLGDMPTRVSAVSRSCVFPDTPDVAFISLTYASGAVAHVELSWLSPSKLRRTAIVGSQKMVVYDDTSNEPVRIFDSGAELPDPETFGEFRLSYRTGNIVSPRVEAVEPLSLEFADFGAAILQGKSLVSSPAMGLDVVRTIEAVDRSLAEGGIPVSVAAQGRVRPASEAPQAGQVNPSEQSLTDSLGGLIEPERGKKRPSGGKDLRTSSSQPQAGPPPEDESGAR